ncbi:MAG: 30S ribosomal protein S18 [Rickettsiaceae bacterium]
MSKEITSELSPAFEMSGDRNGGKTFFKKSKGCPFSGPDASIIDYKDPDLLRKFISEGGRMLPSRITNVSAKHQRALKKAIKHSRTLALLPFVYSNR